MRIDKINMASQTNKYYSINFDVYYINIILKYINTMDNDKFIGTIYRTCQPWDQIIPIENYMSKQINYLEIGAHYGANVISVCQTYGKHTDSVIHVIDPWCDYDDYNEYKDKDQQSSIFNDFNTNISNF